MKDLASKGEGEGRERTKPREDGQRTSSAMRGKRERQDFVSAVDKGNDSNCKRGAKRCTQVI